MQDSVSLGPRLSSSFSLLAVRKSCTCTASDEMLDESLGPRLG